MEPNIPEIPPLIPNPNLRRIPPLIPIEYPKPSQPKVRINPSVKVETDNETNETSSSKKMDNFSSSNDTSSIKDPSDRDQVKTSIPIHETKEIKREPVEEELGGSDQEKWVAPNDATRQMRQFSTLVQEDALVEQSNIGMDNETMSQQVLYFSMNFWTSLDISLSI